MSRKRRLVPVLVLVMAGFLLAISFSGPVAAQEQNVSIDTPVYDSETSVFVDYNTGDADNATLKLLQNGNTVGETTVTGEGTHEFTGLSLAPDDQLSARLEASDPVYLLTDDTEVREGSEFDVTFDQNTYEIPQGFEGDIDTTVTNVGDAEDTQTIQLTIEDDSGPVANFTEQLTLAAGASETITFVWNTSGYSTGAYDAQLESEANTDLAAISVVEPEPPNFVVREVSHDGPVRRGDVLLVDALIENTGDETDSQFVELLYESFQYDSFIRSDSQEITLGRHESQQVTLEWDTLWNKEREHEISVRTADDVSNDTVDVIQATEADRPAIAFRTVYEAHDTVTFDVEYGADDNAFIGMNSSTWPEGEAFTDHINQSVDGNTYTVPEENLSRLEEQHGPITAGDTLYGLIATGWGEVLVTTTVQDSTPTIRFDTPVYATEDSVTVEIDLNGADGAGFEVTNTATGATYQFLDVTRSGTYEISASELRGLSVGDDLRADVSNDWGEGSDATTVQADEANFAVEITSANDAVDPGDTVAVSTRIENTGAGAGSQTIELSVGGERVDDETVQLGPGETTDVTLLWQADDAGTFTLTVSSDDDSDTHQVQVGNATAEGQRFDLNLREGPDSVRVGDVATYEVIVINSGGRSGTQDVVLRVDGDARDSRAVELAPSAVTDIVLAWEPPQGSVGDHAVEIASDNRTLERSLAVLEPADPARFEVTILGTNAPVEAGATATVDVSVTNNGSLAGTETISLQYGGAASDEATVSLEPGETTELALEWDTRDVSAGDHNITAAGETTSDATTLTVEPVVLAVSIQSLTYDEDSDLVEVVATLENTGGVETRQDVTATANGEFQVSQEERLGAGESRNVTFAWEAGDVDLDEYSVEVASETDSDERTESLSAGGSGTFSATAQTVSVGVLLLIALLVGGYYYWRRLR